MAEDLEVAAEARGYDRATRDAVAWLRKNADEMHRKAATYVIGTPECRIAIGIANHLTYNADQLERGEHVGAGDET